jgi:cellulose synthase/poly-beta-1,6-N-acetylglucosamine synthase-like glycosyltransferase
MEDLVMQFSVVLFLSLFAVLGLFFAVTVAAFLKKRTWDDSFQPEVSVLIPAYNEENNIKACLDAVMEAEYPKDRIEIMVIDDGSSDKTLEIAGGFRGVKILKQAHKGKVGALNLGLSKAGGEVVITLDADVVIEKDFFRNVVKPFSDPKVGVVSGVAKVANSGNMLSTFQSIEYVYSSLIMDSFSTVFGTSFWSWGALASYRKSALLKAGGFSSRTEAEDFDIMVEVKKFGYKTLSAGNARGRTVVPSSMAPLFKQRMRWWKGMLQTMSSHRDVFGRKPDGFIMFLFFTRLFWFFYSILAIPVITYQIIYWLPYNSATLLDVFFYLFRWFNLVGAFYVLYKIPEWGISLTSIFGVLAGIMTVFMILVSLKMFGEKIGIKKCIAVFFYFPYTILMGIMTIMGALIYALNRGKGTFIK